jgi:hypothetical protein
VHYNVGYYGILLLPNSLNEFPPSLCCTSVRADDCIYIYDVMKSYTIMKYNIILLYLLLSIDVVVSSTPKPWDKYNYAPLSRNVKPINGGDNNNKITLSTKNNLTHFLFDFGKEVGGIITLSFGQVSSSSSREMSLGLTFSESTNYASCPSQAVNTHCKTKESSNNNYENAQAYSGDDSNGSNPSNNPDGYISTGIIETNTKFTVKDTHLRGGFRYLNVFLENINDDEEEVEIIDVGLFFTAAPSMGSTPNNYLNHFYSSDDLLNQIWYASAYTIQMCLIDSSHGRAWPPPQNGGWNNNNLIGMGKSILVDGAKRDRTIWPGDMGISISTLYATLGDANGETTINSLGTLYLYQNKETGQLPYVGPMVFCLKPYNQTCDPGKGAWNSDMYHLWTLKGTYDAYKFYSSSASSVQSKIFANIYKQYKFALLHSISKIDWTTNLFIVDKTADWQRQDQGGKNLAANALLYHVLCDGIKYANDMADMKAANLFGEHSNKLKNAINTYLWNETLGAYKDNPTSTIYPQDGNSMAVWFNVTTEHTDKIRILKNLKSNWNEIGSVSPEWKYQGKFRAIGTFPSSMEVLARLATDQVIHGSNSSTAKDGIDLIKRTWGYMLQSPNSTRSTFWEGFQANGQFAFDGIYMSHAHGWATGPASALSFHLLGIQPSSPPDVVSINKKKENFYHYHVAPQILHTGIAFVNGSLTLVNFGVINVAWKNEQSSNKNNITISIDTTNCFEKDVIGRIGIQFFGQKEIKHTIKRNVDLDSDGEETVKIIPVKQHNFIYGDRIWMDIGSRSLHVFESS